MSGGLSPYGTCGQNGNLAEWMENAVVRGGDWVNGSGNMMSASRYEDPPTSYTSGLTGFRVASVPEPGSALLLAAAIPVFLRRRRQPDGA